METQTPQTREIIENLQKGLKESNTLGYFDSCVRKLNEDYGAELPDLAELRASCASRHVARLRDDMREARIKGYRMPPRETLLAEIIRQYPDLR